MRKVLIAEDELEVRALIEVVVEKSGYRAMPCENGAVAWARLQEEGADMAVLDVNMPEMDGFELCHRIRTHDKFKSMPILMLTIRFDPDDQAGGYDSGADDYMSKPFKPPLLTARLKALEKRLLK